MKKPIIIIAIIVSILALGVVITMFVKYSMRKSQIKERLSETIGKDEGITELLLKLPKTNITYGETFDLCDKSVEKRNDLIIDLRGLYPDMKSNVKDSLIDFLSVENDLSRDIRQVYHVQLEVSNDADKINELQNNSYSYYYMSEINTLRNEITDDATKYDTYKNNFDNEYNSLLRKEIVMNEMMKNEGIRFMQIYSKYKSVNIGDSTSNN